MSTIKDSVNIISSETTVSTGNAPVISEEVYNASIITAAQKITEEITQLIEKKLPVTVNSQMFIKGMETGTHIGGMGADIVLSYKKEGIVQATITAGLSTSLTAGLTLYVAGTIGGSLVTTALIAYLGYQFGKWLDDRYTLGKNQFDIWWDNKHGKAIADTSISNVSDLKEIITPLYNSAKDCDLNEIEIRVRPESGSGSSEDDVLVYTVQPGDTMWDLSQLYDASYEEFFELNPWLRDRFSEDGEFALIRPNEKLWLPGGSSALIYKYDPTFKAWVDFAGVLKHAVDPMFVDLNGDGKMGTTTVSDGIHFDHENDGFKELSSWVSKEDGVFVIDKNNDGVIDNGLEIFGDNYIKSNGKKASNGFDALADLDSNGDGVINSSDKDFSKIKILKGDGSLISLEEAGIVSISLDKVSVNEVDENGNTLVYQGTYTKEDGTVGNLGTFNLLVNKVSSEERNKVEVSEDVALLPDIKSYGTVHSLHQAMMLDSSGVLKGLVEEFVNAEDINVKKEKLIQILYKWTGADGIADNSRGEYFNGKRLHVIEQFMGEGYIGVDNSKNPNNQAGHYLGIAFNTLFNEIYARLQAQLDLKDVLDLVEHYYSFEENKIMYDLSKVQEYIDGVIAEDETKGKTLLGNFATSFAFLGLRNLSNYEDFSNHYAEFGEEYGFIAKEAIGKVILNGTEENDNITGTYMFDAIFAGSGDDTILSGDGNDFVFGGEGNDSIDGGANDDIIYGGEGNDTIIGGAGNDIIYGGDGDDLLDPGELGNDTIYGGAGNDTIRRTGASHGESWYFDGEEGDDSITGGLGRNTLIGGAGNDIIISQGDDFVYGGEGDDSITASGVKCFIDGGEGNDTILYEASSGEVTISGGKGDDSINVVMKTYAPSGSKILATHRYNLGDGDDTITSRLEYIKAIEFGEGITKENICFQPIRLPNNSRTLAISFKDAEGSITIPGATLGQATNIPDFLKFADGTTWSYWDILMRLEMHGTEGDDNIKGSAASEKIYGYGGNDTIYLDHGSDTIIGGKGDDYISANEGYVGNDVFIYNMGDGNDTINSGKSKTIEFGEGITIEDIQVSAEGNDLIIGFENAEGSIRITSSLSNSKFSVDTFKFSDGSTLTNDQMKQHMNTRATNAQTLAFETGVDDADVLYMPDFNVNKIIQDMAGYNAAEDALISYDDNINREKELLTLVSTS